MQARVTLDEAEVAILLAGGTVPECGNDVVEGDESCDGSDLAGQDCVSLGYASGTLGCTTGCGYDVSGCTPYSPPSLCGNGLIDPAEDCDFQALNGEDCISQGFAGGGTLDCAAGCSFDTSGCVFGRYAFVTSMASNGNLGGLAGADSICQGAADAAGLPGIYKAWLSDSTGSPAVRFQTGNPLIPYVRTDGTWITHNWWNLSQDGFLYAPLDHDEFGNPVIANGDSQYRVWTDTVKATPQIYDAACNDWSSLVGEAYVGDWSATNGTWEFFYYHRPCASLARLYCFQQ